MRHKKGEEQETRNKESESSFMDIKYGNDVISMILLVFATCLAFLNAVGGLVIKVNPHHMKLRPYKSCKTIGFNFFVTVFLVVSIIQTINKKQMIEDDIDQSCYTIKSQYDQKTGQEWLTE
jgi:hypothetical protein